MNGACSTFNVHVKRKKKDETQFSVHSSFYYYAIKLCAVCCTLYMTWDLDYEYEIRIRITYIILYYYIVTTINMTHAINLK